MVLSVGESLTSSIIYEYRGSSFVCFASNKLRIFIVFVCVFFCFFFPFYQRMNEHGKSDERFRFINIHNFLSLGEWDAKRNFEEEVPLEIFTELCSKLI